MCSNNIRQTLDGGSATYTTLRVLPPVIAGSAPVPAPVPDPPAPVTPPVLPSPFDSL